MIRDTAAQDRPRNRPPRTLRRLALPLAIGAVLLAVSAYATRSWLAGERSVDVGRLRIAAVQRDTLVRDLDVEGRVTAANSPTLYAVAAGNVHLDVVAGDAVSRGQVLARIASPELQSRLAQERATLESLDTAAERAALDVRQGRASARMQRDQAEIDRQTAARELERRRRGFARGVVAEMDLLSAEDDLRKAEVALRHAEEDAELRSAGLGFDLRTRRQIATRQRALVQELSRQVEALVIRSPVAGQVGQVRVAQRDNVAANQPVLSVVDLTAFEIEFRVPESFARDLALGMPAQVRAGPERYPATVRSISAQVVDGEVVGRLRFDGSGPPGLRQNQRLSARILVDEKPGVLMVERGPFLEAGGGRHAYFVSDGRAERRPLQTGAASLDAVEIVAGASAGDRIVIAGSDLFAGAQRVRLSGP